MGYHPLDHIAKFPVETLDKGTLKGLRKNLIEKRTKLALIISQFGKDRGTASDKQILQNDLAKLDSGIAEIEGALAVIEQGIINV